MATATTETRSTVEILKAARERISDPARWATKEYAYDSNGGMVDPNDRNACRWCAVGAVLAELGKDYVDDDGIPTLWSLGFAASPGLDPDDEAGIDSAIIAIATLNDNAGHDSVLALYDRAIELAEASA